MPFKQYRKMNKGASLAYTLMVMAILMIIGGVLASFAVVSLRIAVMQHASDKAFYLSDSAMEETLVQLESMVHDAEVYAVNKVNNTAGYYSEPKWVSFLAQMESDLNQQKITVEKSTELLKNASSMEFHKQYYYYLFNKPNSSSWLAQDYQLLNADGTYVATPQLSFNNQFFDESYFSGLETINIDPSLHNGYNETPKPLMTVTATLVDNVIELNLTSNGQFNAYRRPIVVEVALVPPDYTQIINTENTNIEVHNNQALDYALAARGDLIITEGDKNTIEGNVYSYGTFPEQKDYRISQQGGVLVGYKNTSNIIQSAFGDFDPTITNTNASLTVTGDLITRSSLRIFGSQSDVTINKNLYANSVIFDQNTIDSDVQVDENAFLFEDLILDGDDPSFTLGKTIESGNGMFWGIMEHEPSGSVNTGRSDLSSSIIVNTKSSNPRITVNNAYIAGLAYFNVFRDDSGKKKFYQTGESFTTNNNFYFYDTKAPGNTEVTTTMPTYYDENNNEYYLYEAIDATGKVVESPQFKADLFFNAGQSNPTAVTNRDRNILNVRSIDLSNGNLVGLENNYALGVMIANTRVIDPYPDFGNTGVINSEYMNAGAFASLRNNALRNADYRMNLLSTRDYINGINQDVADATNSKIGKFFDFSYGNLTRVTDPKNMIVVNGNAVTNLYLNVPASKAASLRSEDPGAIIVEEKDDTFLEMNGMIITKGNVFIYNDSNKVLHFNGSIISDQSIVLMGAGEKVFTHSENWLNNTIARDNLLSEICHADEGRMLEIAFANGSETTSDNGSLSLLVKSSPSVTLVSGSPQPVGNGLIKSNVEHSFLIRKWSIED